MTQGRWRAMEPDDIGVVAAIPNAVHGTFTEPVSVYAERLALYPAGCFVLEWDGTIAGYLIGHPWTRASTPALGQPLGVIPADADTYYLHDVALLPAARGKGAGHAALGLVIAQARADGFADVTLTAVHGADRFWVTQSFVRDEGDSAYGEGTCRMRLPL